MSDETHLEFLLSLDSPEMAVARKRELDIARETARDLGQSAVEIARANYGDVVARKISIPPDMKLPGRGRTDFPVTKVQVSNETTLGAAQRLIEMGLRPLALNFANGLYPGGGFLSGARAQEEYLCRSSALYLTLEGDPMYAAHAQRPTPDSSDWTILSPDVPVFRDDAGATLSEPWLLSFVSCAAPVATKVGQPLSGDLLQQRIHRVLRVAEAYEYTSLVIGAWGCGAFGNDPYRTAKDFKTALETEFAGAFEHVVFAIADWSRERRFLAAFRNQFSRRRLAR